jgi:hypothetical protein
LYKWIKNFDGVGLASGESYVVTYTYVLPDAGVQWLYVQADTFWNGGADPDPQWGSSAYGRIDETDEQNNIYGPVSIDVQSGKVYLPIVMKNK